MRKILHHSQATFRPAEPAVVKELGYPYVCCIAAFELEQPLSLDPDDLLILEDGKWFLKSAGVTVELTGRWISKQI